MEDGRRSGRRLARRLLLLLRLWQFVDLVRCHVDLNSVADAVELIIGDANHVGAETEKATDFDSDGDFAAGPGHYAVHGT